MEDNRTAHHPEKDAFDVLQERIRAVSSSCLSKSATILTDSLSEKFPTAAILFYGSGNSVNASENPADIIFDFYVIAPSYAQLFSSPTLRMANRLLPPNVFYFECDSEFGTLRAKYATLSLDHFKKLNSRSTFHSYFWARFAQPCRIIDPSGALIEPLTKSLAQAITTFCLRSAALVTTPFQPRDLWVAGLGVSYKAELRAESPERASRLIESYGDWAKSVTAPALRAAGLSVSEDGQDHISVASKQNPTLTILAWRVRALQGAVISALRLLKGTQTFNGGIDYIAWKIKRHNGVDVGISDWERRHPLLAAPRVALRYYRQRAKQAHHPSPDKTP